MVGLSSRINSGKQPLQLEKSANCRGLTRHMYKVAWFITTYAGVWYMLDYVPSAQALCSTGSCPFLVVAKGIIIARQL